jgi:hypothetical protein
MEINVNAVETLEEFVFAMALHAVSVETLYELVRKALQDEYLEVDEMEQVETIAYEAKRIFHAIDALVHLMGERADIDAKAISSQLKKKMGVTGKKTASTSKSKKVVKKNVKKTS